MSYRLFLDDERDPPDDGQDWKIVRSVNEAMNFVFMHGFPAYVSFDNELGEIGCEGRDFAKWLIEEDIENGTMPDNFAWYAHTQNPIARDAIDGILSAYMRHKANITAPG